MTCLRVALYGPYASRNLGDMATQMAAMQNLRRRIPDICFVGISPEPDDTLRSLGIPAFPMSGIGAATGDIAVDVDATIRTDWRRHGVSSRLAALRRISRFVRSLDLLIVSGGGQLDDFWGGPWGHPWSMLLWTTIARRHGVPVAYLAVGLDNLAAGLSRFFSVQAMRLASVRSFRDPDSRSAMVGMGMSATSTVCPDLVFALDVDPTDFIPEQGQFAVLSPISHRTWSHTETRTHDDYIDALVAAGLAIAGQGLAIRIVCSQTVMDTADARRLAAMLAEGGAQRVAVWESPRVEDFLRCVRGANLVVASRLHAAILSLVAGCPVVAVAHLDKVTAVMRSFGLGDYCLSLRSLDRDELVHRVLEALRTTDRLRVLVAGESAKKRSALDEAFDAVATAVTGKTAVQP